jgi:hypothetical protein
MIGQTDDWTYRWSNRQTDENHTERRAEGGWSNIQSDGQTHKKVHSDKQLNIPTYGQTD